MESIDVILAERELPALRGALRELKAAGDINVVAHTGNGGDLLTLVQKHQPRVVIIAILLEGPSGLDVLERLPKDTLVLIFTIKDDAASVFRAMIAGARGYVLKWDKEITLTDAVRRVADGEVVISRAMLKPFINAVRERLQDGEPPLSPREREVLQLLGGGNSYRQIARIMNISEHTVKNHCSQAYRKLQVKNQTEAVRKALSLGLIDNNGK